MRSKQELDELQHETRYRTYVNSSSMSSSSRPKTDKPIAVLIESNIAKRQQAKKEMQDGN